MRKMFLAFVSVMMFMLLPMMAMAMAQDAAAAAPTPPEGWDLIPALIEAAQGGRWSLLVSLIILFLVWLVTKAPVVSDLIKGPAKVWTAAIAGTCMAIGVAIFTTMPDNVGAWFSTIFAGLTTGLAATGLWELITRTIEKKPIDANNDGVLDPLPEDTKPAA